MKNVYIYCEGQTEEAFINEVLYPYFIYIEIFVRPIICTTKRTKTAKFKGGVSDYFKIKKELTIICKQHQNEKITTMFDYYAIPSNTPGIDSQEADIFLRIKYIEKILEDDIGMPNLFFNLVLHEFEGLLFSKPDTFKTIVDDNIVDDIIRIRNEFDTPEHINNSFETAPSKRLEKLIPNYPKVKNGTIISKEIGMDRIVSECNHFAKWIEKIRNC